MTSTPNLTVRPRDTHRIINTAHPERAVYIIPVGQATGNIASCKTIKDLFESNPKSKVVFITPDKTQVARQLCAFDAFEIEEQFPIKILRGENLFLQLVEAVCRGHEDQKYVAFISSKAEAPLVRWIVQKILRRFPDFEYRIHTMDDGSTFSSFWKCRIRNFWIRCRGFRRYTALV